MSVRVVIIAKVLIHKSCLQCDVQWKNDFCQPFSADSPEALSPQGLPILWRKTFAADATIDGVIREFCSRHRLIVDTCVLEHAGHPLGCGVRLDQVFENIVALFDEGFTRSRPQVSLRGLTALRHFLNYTRGSASCLL